MNIEDYCRHLTAQCEECWCAEMQELYDIYHRALGLQKECARLGKLDKDNVQSGKRDWQIFWDHKATRRAYWQKKDEWYVTLAIMLDVGKVRARYHERSRQGAWVTRPVASWADHTAFLAQGLGVITLHCATCGQMVERSDPPVSLTVSGRMNDATGSHSIFVFRRTNGWN